MNHHKLRNTATTAFWTLHELVMRYQSDMKSLEGRQCRVIQDDGSYGSEPFLTKEDIDELDLALSTLGRLAFDFDCLIPEPGESIGPWEHEPSAEFSV